MPIAFRNKITHLAEKNVDIFFHIQSVAFLAISESLLLLRYFSYCKLSGKNIFSAIASRLAYTNSYLNSLTNQSTIFVGVRYELGAMLQAHNDAPLSQSEGWKFNNLAPVVTSTSYWYLHMLVLW